MIGQRGSTVAGRTPDGQQELDPPCDARPVDDLLQPRQRDHDRRVAPSSLTACSQRLGGADPGQVH